MDFAMLHCAIFLIFYLPLNVLSQLSPNATLGSSLTANNGNDSWTSPSGEFAFGFIQSPGGTGEGYLLAIWFNKIPEKTVIWSANRDKLAQEGSRLQLFEDGRFELNDPTGNNIWDANTGGVGVAYGAMLDTGNFVLVSNSSLTLWQSFDTPTDSLLPSQKLIKNEKIVPNLSGTNYSSGKFQLIMQIDGNLVLYTRQYPLLVRNSAYWTTQIFGNDFELVFNQSGTVTVLAQNGSLITSVFSNVVSSDQYYQRLTLDYDGVLRHYVYPKSSRSTGGRPMAWSVIEFVPSNICMRIKQDSGGGLCGYNSVCSLGNDSKPVCKCPAGYSLIVPNDSMSGCYPDFVPQSCDNKLNETGNFGYTEMLNSDWPFSNFEQFQNVSEDWCRQVCLGDCFCVAATFADGNCYLKESPLLVGRTDASIAKHAWIKVRQRNSGMSTTIKNKKSSKSVTIIIVVCAIVTLLVLTLSLCAFITRRRRQKANTGEEDEEEIRISTTQYEFASIRAATEDFSTANMLGSGEFGAVYKGVLSDGKEIAVKRLSTTSSQGEKEFRNEVKLLAKLQHNCLVRLLGFCLERTERLLIYEFMENGSLDKILFEEDEEEILIGTTQYEFASLRAATEDFSTANMLGSGGFGAVYKGVLSDGKEIAVKRLSTTSSQGEKEFRNEVKLLAKLQHNCLVRLLGFCFERTERLLIYEFMKNGSLDKILFDPEHQSRLDWEGRYRIIKRIARGLLYLHEDSRLMVIHRDLKASNILLDEEMNAKISDFGMARLFVEDASKVVTKRIAGTLGYMSPEYAMHGLFSVKSDVYSYGVLLLEIISGKRNNDFLTEDTAEGLPSYAYKAWKKGKATDLIDPVVTAHDSHSLETVMRCIHIGLLCVQDNVGSRPTMAEIVLMLQSLTVTLPLPFEPGFFLKTSYWRSESVHTAAQNDPPGSHEETDSYLYPR